MKIMHILQSNQFSGAENVVCQIISMMQTELDIESVYCSRDGQIRDALAERNISFSPMKVLSLSEVRRVLKEQQPDIIHAHDMRAGFVAALVCGKIPIVSHIHNNAFNSRGISPKSIAYLLAACKARHIFWVSQSSYNGYCFHSLLKKKSSILYNIINSNALYEKMKLDTASYNYDVIYLGRLTPPKNPQRLLRVLSIAIKEKPDLNVAIIGTGELEYETKKLCNELRLQNNVQFLGFQSNPLKMLHDSKVMIMTSRWEGTPMCALEAMALGIPIVSTPTDGMSDLVEDGVSGYLSNDDAVLAQRICMVVRESETRGVLSANSLQRSNNITDIVNFRKEIICAYRT